MPPTTTPTPPPSTIPNGPLPRFLAHPDTWWADLATRPAARLTAVTATTDEEIVAPLRPASSGVLVSTQHRLVALWRLGVLERFRPLRPTGSESWRYTLGPVGAAIIAADRGVEAPRSSVFRNRVVSLATGQRTAHTLGVNGFFCALHKAARQLPGAAVLAWWSERRCAAEWGELVRPDAYGIWEEDGCPTEFFLEHDTGSEPLSRVAGKLDGYRDLAEADGMARPVLFWLSLPGREPGLRQALRAAAVPVATAVAATGNPADAVWLPVGEEAPRQRLAQLGTLAARATR